VAPATACTQTGRHPKWAMANASAETRQRATTLRDGRRPTAHARQAHHPRPPATRTTRRAIPGASQPATTQRLSAMSTAPSCAGCRRGWSVGLRAPHPNGLRRRAWPGPMSRLDAAPRNPETQQPLCARFHRGPSAPSPLVLPCQALPLPARRLFAEPIPAAKPPSGVKTTSPAPSQARLLLLLLLLLPALAPLATRLHTHPFAFHSSLFAFRLAPCTLRLSPPSLPSLSAAFALHAPSLLPLPFPSRSTSQTLTRFNLNPLPIHVRPSPPTLDHYTTTTAAARHRPPSYLSPTHPACTACTATLSASDAAHLPLLSARPHDDAPLLP
jgi:hypothetical protein